MEEGKMHTGSEAESWFALGAPYRNEAKVRERLTHFGIKSWLPLVRIQEKCGSRKKWVEKPAIGNLLFAYCTEKRLLEVKPFIPRLQFKVTTEDGFNRKVTVPDAQMENFINFISKLSSVPQFFDAGLLDLKKGEKVKVISGPFTGVEGTFIRLKGHRKKSLCITLASLGSSVVEITPDCVQKVED